MKKNYILNLIATFSFIFVSHFGFSQNMSTCGTTQYMNDLKAKDPKFNLRAQLNEARLQKWITDHATEKLTNSVMTIPIVVHNVYNTVSTGGYLSDSQIMAAVATMNENYSRTNADTIDTPAIWQSIAASPNIQFCFAQRDPSGGPTNGIEHVLTTVGTFSSMNQIVQTSQGGADWWDASQYFNIWTVPAISGGVLGIGLFPENGFEGLAVASGYFVGGGWIASHEGGHCFDLIHIWGDDGGACGGNGDYVLDTPDQGNSVNSCGPWPVYDACQPSGDGIMYCNYMNYSGCPNLFTQGQVARMYASVNTYYATVLTSTACNAVVLQTNDAQTKFINSPLPYDVVCTGSITPTITLKNMGTSALTSVTINYNIDGGANSTYTWTGNLASLATTSVTLPAITTGAGDHALKVFTSQPNGQVDGNATNDTLVNSPFTVSIVGSTIPLFEGFESTAYPGWRVINPDAKTTWSRITNIGYAGNACVYMNNKNYQSNGEFDDLIMPTLNLTTLASPTLTFYVAYQLLTDPASVPNYSDTLGVLISTDCGQTFTSLYKNYGTSLVTASPAFSTVEFFPTAGQWRKETVDLSAYSSYDNVIIKFRNTTDFENNLFLDNINISSPTGIAPEQLASEISLYPNPGNGKFNLQTRFSQTTNLTISIQNLLGEKVLEQKVFSISNSQTEINLEIYPKGIYMVDLITDAGRVTKKLVLQ